MMRPAGILTVWRDWIGVFVLAVIAFGILPAIPSIRSIRARYNTSRCRDQMEMILRAEEKHYLDHRSYTTVQRDLNRYEAFAPHARCPLCKEPYQIEITQTEIWVQCPCSPGLHGWKHATAPLIPGNISSEDSPLPAGAG